MLQTANNLEEVTENVDYYVQGSTVAAGNLFGRYSFRFPLPACNMFLAYGVSDFQLTFNFHSLFDFFLVLFINLFCYGSYVLISLLLCSFNLNSLGKNRLLYNSMENGYIVEHIKWK